MTRRPSMRTVTRPFAILSLAVAACGGNPARDRALDAAAVARAHGDLVGETLAMREACAADPKNKKVCTQAGEVGERARAATKAGATSACALVASGSPGTIDGCVAALGPLRALYPDDPDAVRMAEAAGAAFAARCGRDAPAEIANRIARARCADAGIAVFAAPRYTAWAATTRADAARALVDLAATVTDRAGARAALLDAARCMAAAEVPDQVLGPAWGAFVTTSAPTLHVRGTGLAGGELCTATAQALGDRLACVATPDSRSVVLEAKVTLGPIQHEVSERTQTERYLAGTERYENPAYPVRARDELYSREQARAAEEQYRRDQATCDDADGALSRASYCYDCQERTYRDSVCRRAEDSKALWDTRATDWQSAKTALADTPAVIEREDWRDTSFVVRDHTWSAPWEADLRALPGQTTRSSGAAQATDSESRGSDLAGIAADPLSPPGAGWYLPVVRQQVATALGTLASAELSARATTLRARCPADAPAWNDPAWLDCYATALLVGGGDHLGYALLVAEAAAWDRRGAGLPEITCR